MTITDEQINEVRDSINESNMEAVKDIIKLSYQRTITKASLVTMMSLVEKDPLQTLSHFMSMGIYIGYKIKEKEVEVNELNKLNI